MSNVQPQLLNRAKLKEALASGQYHQIRGTYRVLDHDGRPTAFCFIGLAYHLMDGRGWDTYFVEELQEAYGFRNPLTLMSMNDGGMTFEGFVNLINEHSEFVYRG